MPSLRTIVPLLLAAALLLPAAADAADVKRSIKGADLTLTVPDACTDVGRVTPALLTVKMKKSATWKVRSVEWRVDGRRVATRYSAPYDLRLATTSYAPASTQKLEARVFTEWGQKKPKVTLTSSIQTC